METDWPPARTQEGLVKLHSSRENLREKKSKFQTQGQESCTWAYSTNPESHKILGSSVPQAKYFISELQIFACKMGTALCNQSFRAFQSFSEQKWAEPSCLASNWSVPCGILGNPKALNPLQCWGSALICYEVGITISSLSTLVRGVTQQFFIVQALAIWNEMACSRSLRLPPHNTLFTT